MWKKNSCKNKSVAFLLIACFCLTLFGGCLPKENTDGETVTFTDALDRTVTAPKNPARVAALIGSFADIWTLAGGTLCASAEDAWDDFALELPDAVSLGGAHSPSVETLLSVDPDLVLASASTASNVELKDLLEQAGITVAYFDVDCFADYLQMLDICTDLTGRKDLFAQNGKAIETQIEAVKEEIANAALSDHVRTVLLLRASSGSVKAKGSKGTVLGEMLSDLGCINIADSEETLLETLSVESIIRLDPHRIFVVTMGDDAQKATRTFTQMLTQNAAWGTLSAVKEERVHIMDRRYFHIKPNAKWAESYERLGNLLLGKED